MVAREREACVTALGQELVAARRELDAALARCAALTERVQDDDDLATLRDLLLDGQFESRQIITAIEVRLGAFEGEDDPRVLAIQAEELIEQIESLQDAWESRVDLLLDAGFADERLDTFFAELLARKDGTAKIDEIFTGLPADMDQAAELLDYGKRYLLSLVVPPPPRR
jgi:hypothetical protein